MPPKKKRKTSNSDSQPGVARKFLCENFAKFPTSESDVTNGHILNIFMSVGGRAETDRQLKTLLSPDCCYKADVKRIVEHSVQKYQKQLSDPTAFQKFVAVCNEPFTSRNAPSQPGDDDFSPTENAVPSSSTSLGNNGMELAEKPGPSTQLAEQNTL